MSPSHGHLHLPRRRSRHSFSPMVQKDLIMIATQTVQRLFVGSLDPHILKGIRWSNQFVSSNLFPGAQRAQNV
uniref:Uncharacterized protein n=1 Tax=Oryza meridionalis TaxID=40149 RepID=A0A0E0C9V0_9ORYZ